MSAAPGDAVASLQQSTATVAFVDVVESVRHIQRDEITAIARMRDLMSQASLCVNQHKGHVVERLGDGLVLRFDSVRQAARCATELHDIVGRIGGVFPVDERLQLRAGIHTAPIWTDSRGLYGLGVNLAARVASMGGPGDTLLTSSARDQLVAGLDGEVQDLGDCYLKHVDEPQRLFRLLRQQNPMSAGLAQAIVARMKTRPTLAIWPFELALMPADGLGALNVADIVSDQLVRQLSRSPMLHVISAGSSNALRLRNLPMADAYKVLGADYILRGKVFANQMDPGASNRIEVVANLWRAGCGEPVWSETVKATALDALTPESDLLGHLIQAVSQRILTVEQRMAKGTQALPNLASHTLYLNAVDLLHRFSIADFGRAQQMLQALAERAPRHPEPLAWLARWHVFRVVQGWTDDSARDSAEALSYSERALDRDPESALALTMAGSVHAGVMRDPAKAQSLYEKALAANPNDSMAWVMSGVSTGFLHRHEECLCASEMGLGLAPLDPLRFYYESLGATSAVFARDFGRTIELADRAIQGNRTHGSPYRAKAIAQVMRGEIDAARQTVNALLAIEPHTSQQHFLARVGPLNAQKTEFAQALALAGLPAE